MADQEVHFREGGSLACRTLKRWADIAPYNWTDDLKQVTCGACVWERDRRQAIKSSPQEPKDEGRP